MCILVSLCSWAIHLLPAPWCRLLQQLGAKVPLWCHHLQMCAFLVWRMPRQQQQLHDPSRVPAGMSGACTQPAGPSAGRSRWRAHETGNPCKARRWRKFQRKRIDNRWVVTQHGENLRSPAWLDRQHRQAEYKRIYACPQRQSLFAGTPAFNCHSCTAHRSSCEVRWRARESGEC